MSALNPELLRQSAIWMEYADDDLVFARAGLTIAAKRPYRFTAYHAQQCAEKCLKAYLVARNIDFPYTHSIRRLLEFCDESTGWAKTLEYARVLTAYSSTARYPRLDQEVREEEALRAVEIAAQVRQVVREALRQEGVELSESET